MVRIHLETERLVLRRFTDDDVENLHALDSDPEVMRFLNGGRPTPREAIRDEFLPHVLEWYRRFPAFGYWATVERSTQTFLGWFALHPRVDGDPDDVELGYRLRRSAWGRGYATEGSRALIHQAFAELGVRRVFATTMTVNTRSRRVMEKVGLTLVRTFFQEWPDVIEGGEHGDVEYALERADWQRMEAAAGGQPAVAPDSEQGC